MGSGRVVSSLSACVVVAGCAVLAVGMGRAAEKPAADKITPTHASAAPTSRPATLPIDGEQSATSSSPAPIAVTHARAAASSVVAAPRTSAPTTSATAAAPAGSTTAAARPVVHVPVTHHRAAPVSHAPAPAAHPASHPASHAAPPAAPRGGSLPLHYSTYSATKVVTVVASHTYSTTARLQAWVKAPGGGWLRSGAQWTAHTGSQGLTSSPSEFKSATPIGSFSMTRAFGRYSDPGTSLPYHKVDSHDYWISHRGSTYNTMQHCYSYGCYTGSDEHLIDANPEYNYAAVINYNTTARVYPNGSAFFLHVSDGGSTAGCVSVAQAKMISLLRWLTPSSAPRILIGIG